MVAAAMASLRVDGESVEVTLRSPPGGQRGARVPQRPSGLQQLHLVREAGVVERAVASLGSTAPSGLVHSSTSSVLAAGLGTRQHGAAGPTSGVRASTSGT